MATQANKNAETKTSLVSKIIAVFTGGDEAKLRKFFAKEARKFTTNVKSLKHNLAAEKSQYAILKEKIADMREDAVEAVDAAFEDVKPENVANNATMEEFSDLYWAKIRKAEAKVEEIESLQKELEDAVVEGGSVYVAGESASFTGSKTINKTIARYEARIAKIS